MKRIHFDFGLEAILEFLLFDLRRIGLRDLHRQIALRFQFRKTKKNIGTSKCSWKNDQIYSVNIHLSFKKHGTGNQSKHGHKKIYEKFDIA